MIKTIVITGANTGIGKATAISLAKLGHKLILINRDSDKSRKSLEEIKTVSGNSNIETIYADLSSSKDINEAGEIILQKESFIDVLINNAGVFKAKKEFNSEGLEMNLAINYLATARLTEKLLPLIQKSQQGRIINLSSELHKSGNIKRDIFNATSKYRGNRSYADTKLAVVLYTLKMAEILKDTNITVNSLHPEVIASEVFRDYNGQIFKLASKVLKSPEKGALPSIKLALDPELKNITGYYFYQTKQQNVKAKFNNSEYINKLWERTQKYL